MVLSGGHQGGSLLRFGRPKEKENGYRFFCLKLPYISLDIEDPEPQAM